MEIVREVNPVAGDRDVRDIRMGDYFTVDVEPVDTGLRRMAVRLTRAAECGRETNLWCPALSA